MGRLPGRLVIKSARFFFIAYSTVFRGRSKPILSTRQLSINLQLIEHKFFFRNITGLSDMKYESAIIRGREACPAHIFLQLCMKIVYDVEPSIYCNSYDLLCRKNLNLSSCMSSSACVYDVLCIQFS